MQSLGAVIDTADDHLVIAALAEPESPFELGESVSVDGVDLTVADRPGAGCRADVMPETLRRTALGRLAAGSRVNLERAVRPLDQVSGHLVRGVVEGIARLRENVEDGGARVLRFEAAEQLTENMIVKGPVALDGVSLTLTEVGPSTFAVSVVAHTQAHTTLVHLPIGAAVNVETDILGRYVARHVRR